MHGGNIFRTLITGAVVMFLAIRVSNQMIALHTMLAFYANDLRIAFTGGVKEFMAEHPDAFDLKKYSAVGMERVKAYVMQKMEVVGSVGKA